MIDHGSAQDAMRARLLTATGLPASHVWENEKFTRTVGVAYLADSFVPATMRLRSTCAQGGAIDETGLYVVQYFGLANTGTDDIRTGIDAILAVFAPGTTIISGAGDVIRVRSDVGPQGGQIIPLDASGSGWAVATITIPWQAFSVNVIAA